MNYNLVKKNNFNRRPVLFVIMDGVGIGEKNHPYPEGDCVKNAHTPNLDFLLKWTDEKKLFTQLMAHGTAVGLPTDEDMGNSEVGHNCIGAGKIYSQGARRVNEAIADKTIYKTDVWRYISDISDKNTVHLIGLTSDGNVHSHIEQLFALIEQLAIQVKHIRIHTLLDGRDVPSTSALEYIRPLEEKIRIFNKKYNVDIQIASGGGRMRVTMDRYNSDWNVVKRGWNAHVRGIPESFDEYPGYFETAKKAILKAREVKKGVDDQNLPSFVIVNDNKEPVGRIIDGDSVIFFNYRGDRAIQISRAFEEENFNEFERNYYPKVKYVGMLEYDGDLKIPKKYLVPPPHITHTIGQYLCTEGIRQFACAETHKFGHVTYFWNGNRSGYIDKNLEKYVEIHSDPTEEIPDKPEMKAVEVGDEVIRALESQKYDFLRVNIANGDMCGHTGFKEVATKGVEATDQVIGRLKTVIDKMEGIMIVTADHGNSEEMIDKKGNVKTAHTLNPVPFYIYDPKFNSEYKLADIEVPQLANIAATLMNFLGFKKPEEYFESLITEV